MKKNLRKEVPMNREEILISLRRFKEANEKKYLIRRMGLFGSSARDATGDQSDIDVVVELEKPDLFMLIGIKQDLEEQFHRSVDVVRYRDKMNKFLKKRIDNEAVYV